MSDVIYDITVGADIYVNFQTSNKINSSCPTRYDVCMSYDVYDVCTLGYF
jgi:hypothetical protein